MENEFILTSSEFSKLIGISTESLRSRRRRGMYRDHYVLKNKSYLWKRLAPDHRSGDRLIGGPRSKIGWSVGRDQKMFAASHPHNEHRIPAHDPRPRNKNSGNHKNGTARYPNKAFEIANEIRMVAKAQRKISAAGAAEITDDVIKIAEERRRNRLLESTKPIRIRSYTTGIYDARNEIIKSNKRKFDDDDNTFKTRYY